MAFDHSRFVRLNVFVCAAICLLGLRAETYAWQENKQSEAEAVADSFQRTGINKNPAINESSGLTASSAKNAYWTINDSGGSPTLYLLHRDGRLLAKHTVDAKNIDWEALADVVIDQQRWLVIADVGDNLLRRKQLQLYLLPEPSDPLNPSEAALVTRRIPIVIDATGTQETDQQEFRRQHPETQWQPNSRPANIEAIGVDPTNQSVWLVEKVYMNSRQKTPPGIFVAKLPQEAFQLSNANEKTIEKTTTVKTTNAIVAKRKASFPVRNVTGMSFSPDGTKLIIRNYLNAHLYRRKKGQDWLAAIDNLRPQRVHLPLQLQGEAICFSATNESVLITSETPSQPIWEVDITWYLKQPVQLKSKK